jgi:hypothetical protein
MKPEEVPSYVKNKPEEIRSKWLIIFNRVEKELGKPEAFIAANGWLKRELKKQNFLKRSVVSFDIESEGEFIKRSSDGDEYISLVLNTTNPHYDGRVFTEELLRSWADAINLNPIVGDIDHTQYDELLSGFNSDKKIIETLKNKKGIAKSLKAIFENGRLWVRAVIDKRYKKMIQNSKGVSAEAFITETDDSDKKVLKADLLGFTFNINTKPADSGAVVV